MKSKILYIFLIFQLWSVEAKSQCPTVTITSQEQVNLFNFFNPGCNGVIQGDLIIDGLGVNTLASLDYFLNTVTGNLIIRNTAITNTLGVHNIDIGGGVTIENNSQLVTTEDNANLTDPAYINVLNNPLLENLDMFGGFVSTVVTSIEIVDCPLLTDEDFTMFDNLTSVGSTVVIQNTGIISWTRGNNLTSTGNWLEFRFNEQMTHFDGYNSLTDVGYVRFWDNINLVTIDGFENVTSSSNWSEIDFVSNDNLETITAFSNLTSLNRLFLQVNDILTDVSGLHNITTVTDNLGVINNFMLSDCCFIENIQPPPPTINISNNAPGCNSLADIGSEPPVITCEPDMVVAIDPANCSATYNPIDPAPTDDCSTTISGTVERISPSGVSTMISLAPGAGWNQSTSEIGDWTFIYTAVDVDGQSSSCTRTFTIVDNTIPQWDDPSFTTSLTGICGLSDVNALAAANIPSASDACGTVSVMQVGTSTSLVCGNSEIYTYTYEASDDNGNVSPNYFKSL